MNTPSPAAVKKLADDRKAREAELASSLANAKDKMPPTKSPSENQRSRPSKRGTATNSSRGNETSTSPVGSEESNPVSGEKVRTGTSQSRTTFPRSTSSTPKTGASSESPKTSVSTSTTQKKSSSTVPTGNIKSVIPGAKKVFVPPSRLTQKPFHDNEALQSLRKELENPPRGQFKREYRVNSRGHGKSQGLNSNKENI